VGHSFHEILLPECFPPVDCLVKSSRFIQISALVRSPSGLVSECREITVNLAKTPVSVIGR
jgi:hypothetical protein